MSHFSLFAGRGWRSHYLLSFQENLTVFNLPYAAAILFAMRLFQRVIWPGITA